MRPLAQKSRFEIQEVSAASESGEGETSFCLLSISCLVSTAMIQSEQLRETTEQGRQVGNPGFDTPSDKIKHGGPKSVLV